MKQRVIAGAGAIVLIVAAVLVRTVVGADGGGSSGSSGRDQAPPVVACTADLKGICDVLAADGLIASDAPSLDLAQMDALDPSIEGWITWSDAPGVVNFDSPGTWGSPTVLGSAPLAVLATEPDVAALREDVSGGTCPDEISCAAMRADEQGWSVGVGSPDDSAGLSRLGALRDVLWPDDGTAELDGALLGAILESPANGQRSLVDQAEAIRTRLGELNAVIGPRAYLAAQADTNQGRQRRLRVAPASGIEVQVVLVGTGSDAAPFDPDGLAGSEAVVKAFASVGVNLGERGATVDPGLAEYQYQVRKKGS